ncbi:hypothetical protein AAFF_G00084630 [Aldrovandia affinis]|uniref:GRF-type domain-containing protein n=1 Tax=Aldrovandia affinis TaxID=143900 RepID=A0AAD7RX11_9TELE|nr:hypothetical protein AAFF_G00084630 [Aldrovandia affinis]
MSHDSNGEQLNVDGSVVNASNGHSIQIVFRNSNTTVYSLEKARTFPSGSGVFKTPLLSNGKLGDKIMSRSNIPCSANAKVTCAKEKSQRSGHCMTTPSSSFTIYKDKDDSCISTESRLSSGGLSSVLSANSMFLPSRGTMKMTSPLCTCGRRAKRLTVANGGPNHGRVFFSCPVGKMGSGNRKSCGFFKWESSLLKAKTVSASAYTSLCSVPGASFISSGKSFVNKSLHISPHKKFVMRPSLRN